MVGVSGCSGSPPTSHATALAARWAIVVSPLRWLPGPMYTAYTSVTQPPPALLGRWCTAGMRGYTRLQCAGGGAPVSLSVGRPPAPAPTLAAGGRPRSRSGQRGHGAGVLDRLPGGVLTGCVVAACGHPP